MKRMILQVTIVGVYVHTHGDSSCRHNNLQQYPCRGLLLLPLILQLVECGLSPDLVVCVLNCCTIPENRVWSITGFVFTVHVMWYSPRHQPQFRVHGCFTVETWLLCNIFAPENGTFSPVLAVYNGYHSSGIQEEWLSAFDCWYQEHMMRNKYFELKELVGHPWTRTTC